MRTRITAITLTLLALIACAKERPIQSLLDPDQKWLEKAAFTGRDTRTSWQSKVTVVKTSTDGGFASVGYQSTAKTGHFEFTRDKLQYLSDIGPYAGGSESATPELINSWDIIHHDTNLAMNDGNVTNKEQEDDVKDWSKKKYFEIDWSKADISEAATFPYDVDAADVLGCWQRKSAQLIPSSRTVTDDYISFTISVDYQQNTLCTKDIRRINREDYVYTVQYKYSFRKLVPHPSFKPYAYKGEEDPLRQKFGFFETDVESLKNAPGSVQDGLYQNRILMDHWDANTEHHYYFAPGTPEAYKHIFADPGNGIMAITNKLFASEGLKTRFYVHENTWGDGQVKEFGDIRYSFIKFVDEIDDNAPLGYGPTDADPNTGEILSGNVVIWTGELKSYLEYLKRSNDRQSTKWTNSSLFHNMQQTLVAAATNDEKPGYQDPAKWATALDPQTTDGKVFFGMLPGVTYHPPGGQFTSTDKARSLFNFRNEAALSRFMPGDADKTIHTRLSEARKMIERRAHARDQRRVNTSVYPLEPVMAQARREAGASETNYEQLLDTLLFRTCMHEFGHNLGLRHNFYGSVDKPNFGPSSMTSSVMDYIADEDESRQPRAWGPYDQAALTFAYSDGKMSSQKGFLYCTDEQLDVNALCNQWDRGSSPSEVALSLIENYENAYFVRNYRNDRAYWDTSPYWNRAFEDMWRLKRFLGLYNSAITQQNVNQAMAGAYDTMTSDRVYHDLKMETLRANKLVIAFFNAVLQQRAADRPWMDQYGSQTGEVQRLGIEADKMWAMFFLLGDDTFAYDPNNPRDYMSYVTFLRQPGQESAMLALENDILQSLAIEPVDMEPWFMDFGHAYFAINATSYDNRDDPTLIDKIKVKAYSPEAFTAAFGIPVSADTDMDIVSAGLAANKLKDDYFRPGDVIAYVKVNGKFYVAGPNNPYSFNLIRKVVSLRGSQPLASMKQDVVSLYLVYRYATQDTLPVN